MCGQGYINFGIVVATCQSQCSHALKHTLLYCQIQNNLQNKHHDVLKKT